MGKISWYSSYASRDFTWVAQILSKVKLLSEFPNHTQTLQVLQCPNSLGCIWKQRQPNNQTNKQTNKRKTNTIKDKQTHTEIEEEKEIRWEVFHIKWNQQDWEHQRRNKNFWVSRMINQKRILHQYLPSWVLNLFLQHSDHSCSDERKKKTNSG